MLKLNNRYFSVDSLDLYDYLMMEGQSYPVDALVEAVAAEALNRLKGVWGEEVKERPENPPALPTERQLRAAFKDAAAELTGMLFEKMVDRFSKLPLNLTSKLSLDVSLKDN
jgi:hypothetical protein